MIKKINERGAGRKKSLLHKKRIMISIDASVYEALRLKHNMSGFINELLKGVLNEQTKQNPKKLW